MSEVEVQDIYGLSPVQEGMLFHSVYDAGGAVYLNQLSFTLVGELSPPLLRAAWQEVADRHPILRTQFHWEELERPVQVVMRGVEVPWREVDCGALPQTESEAAVAVLERDELERGFDLCEAPLMRLALARLAADRHRLVWTHHHLLLDGWSLPLVLGEVFALYEARRRGEAPRLEPARPYGEYIAWLQAQGLERAEAYWRAALRGFDEPTRIGLTGPAGARGAAGEYRQLERRLPAAAEAALAALCAEHRLTASTLVQGAWALLLGRYSGRDDVVFGVTVSGRPPSLPGVESMVGLFINTLPLRVAVAEHRPLVEWLQEIQEAQLEMREHEHSPLAEVQGWSEVPRGTPLFESLVVFENYPADRLRRDGTRSLRAEAVRARESTGYPLTLQASQGDGFSLRLTWNERRFPGASAERLLAHLGNLLEGMAARSAARLADLDLLGAEERRQLVAGWNDTARGYPLEGALHHHVEEQAARTPEAIAVAGDGGTLTYRELDAHANRLARRLRRLGVRADDRVAIAVERSLEMMVGLLGILKAGAAYVPLDPDYPRERLNFMLADCGARVVLTQQRLRDRVAAGDLPVVRLDADWEEIAAESAERPDEQVFPEQAAYVIYTSGSTGRPKGVVVPHRGIVNRLLWMQEAYGLTAADRVLQKTPLGFDVSVWELFWPLMTGARLVVAAPGGHRDGRYLADLIAREAITTIHFVPSMLQVFLEEPEVSRCRSLVRVVCSGEALPPALRDRFYARLGETGARLHNLYGPTEASVDVTFWACAPGEPSVPIGHPIANTQVHVLDGRLEPVPVGVPGELFLGGVGLARGYAGRPELTAERFVPDPFAAPGTRLYRTGDLARRLPDGAVEYLGRLDHQVKVRGFRVELGEVEAALTSLPAVREAVVELRHDSAGGAGGAAGDRLVAYLVPRGDAAPAAEELRASLRERLPEPMVPSAFVVLDALPLSPNGKVDRRALPAPDLGRDLAHPFVAPRTPAEELLAAVWSSVLGVEPVGVRDDFFALGGDSIRSLRVLSLARERGLDFTLQQLFEQPTVAELAAVATAGAPDAAAERHTAPFSLVPAADRERLPAAVEDAYPLTMLQAGMLFHAEYEPGAAVYHDLLTLRLAAPFRPSTLRAALARLIARHPVLRSSFDLVRYAEPMQLVQRTAEVPLVIEDLRELPPAAQEKALADWIAAEKARPFDLSRPPLLRCAVHRRGDGDWQLSVGFHHAILDGWSVATLTTELLRLYLGAAAGPSDLEPPPATTFRDYVALEVEARAAAASESYWLERLRGSTRTQLPRWPPAAPAAPAAGRRRVLLHEVPLADEVSAALAALARRAAVPIKSVLLAAHLRVLGLVAGVAEALSGVVASGRPETADGERVLGLFLHVLPLRLALAGGSWLELVQQAFAAEREALPHRRFPLAKLQRALGGEPLFEVAFNFVRFHVYESLGDLAARPADAGRTALLGIDRSPARKDSRLAGGAVLDARLDEATNFPLVVHGSYSAASVPRLRLGLAYDDGRFDTEQIHALGALYARALAVMSAAPEAPYETAELLPDAERALLAAWNDTRRDYRLDLCLHELIARQAESTPAAPAVVFEGEALAYAELLARANGLAHRLRGLGVGPGSRVAVAMERSLEMVVALLGTLQAGAAYVPLDPEYPRDRLAFMLEDCRPDAVLTQERLLPVLPESGRPTLCLEAGRREVAGAPPAGPGASPDDLAYLIYTSGSTGRPKGAMVPHRGIVNRLLWMQEAYGLGAADRVLQKTPMSFDVSVWEYFWPLLTGARLVMARPGGHRDPAYLAAVIAAEGITTLHFVPSMLRAFLEAPSAARLEAPEAARCTSLRRVVCSGEALPPALQERFFARFGGGVELHNLYGPTEASVDVTAWRCAAGRPLVPIGRPIANTRIHVLDPHLLPVPIGSPGELAIGGTGVGRGYFGRPELTAEKFVPDPFGAPGDRLYRTGDLARWLPEGAVDYLGRVDDQVKVRGFRIEPGEIEAELTRHPAVRQAAVVARDDAAAAGAVGNRRLVAYLVAHPGGEPPPVERLREHLRERLPEPMVPAAYVWLAALPLSPNGKLDRRALPEPAAGRPDLERPYAAPESPAERALAAIWERVLGIGRVGVDDDFFALGGDSILSIRVTAMARDRGLEIALPDLFQHKTVRELARAARPAPEDPARLLARLDELSDAEVDALLGGLVGGPAGALHQPSAEPAPVPERDMEARLP